MDRSFHNQTARPSGSPVDLEEEAVRRTLNRPLLGVGPVGRALPPAPPRGPAPHLSRAPPPGDAGGGGGHVWRRRRRPGLPHPEPPPCRCRCPAAPASGRPRCRRCSSCRWCCCWWWARRGPSPSSCRARRASACGRRSTATRWSRASTRSAPRRDPPPDLPPTSRCDRRGGGGWVCVGVCVWCVSVEGKGGGKSGVRPRRAAWPRLPDRAGAGRGGCVTFPTRDASPRVGFTSGPVGGMGQDSPCARGHRLAQGLCHRVIR